jgi:predicted methyltransferase
MILNHRRTICTIVLASLACASAFGTTHLEEAVAAPDRSDADRARDLTSKPAAVLKLMGLKEGMVVVDLLAGGGYYSEILANAVGESGKVYMHNNQAYMQYAGEELAERKLEERKPNVVNYVREISEIDLPKDSVDMVLMVLTYHDMYFTADYWKPNKKQLFAAIRKVLKTDGTLAIVDHVAAPERGSSDAQDLHRIEPKFARQDIESMGFEFAGQTNVLQNTDDNLQISVFDPSVRGKTNRFVYKFVESKE